jgi:hypothetical protein
VGNLSYSLYLWHWPVLAFTRLETHGAPAPALLALAVALSFALAWASYRWIEKPLIKTRAPPPPQPWRRRALQGAALLILAGAGASAALTFTKGLPQRFNAEALALFDTSYDRSPDSQACMGMIREIPYSSSCIRGDTSVAPSIAVWSDSEGMELARVLSEYLAPRHAAVMQLSTAGCGPSLGFDPGYRPYCAAHNQATLDALVKDSRITTVTMVAFYSFYWDQPTFAAGFTQAAYKLHAAGKKIVLVYPLPVFSFDPPAVLGMAVAHGVNPETLGETRAHYDTRNAPIIAWLDGLAREVDARTFKPQDVLCDPDMCHAWKRGVGSLYFNATHLGMAGQRYVLGKEDVDELWPPIDGEM